MIPLFPELVEPLMTSAERAPEGAVYVVDERLRRCLSPQYGWRNANLRTQFERVIRRAGLAPWPRLFHALRASRETELLDSFPIQTVVA